MPLCTNLGNRGAFLLVFTATVVTAQPITGSLLGWRLGWPLTEERLLASLVLYVITSLFWSPIEWTQVKMRNLAWIAAESAESFPYSDHWLFSIWFACGALAFVAVLAIVWLMVAPGN